MQKGFTLLELLISVGIITLIGAASLASFINSRNIRDLAASGQNVISIIKLAQSKTLAGENNNLWGVHLEQSKFTLFEGATYAGAISTQAHLLPPNIKIANIALAGGGPDVLFQKLTGKTTKNGTFDLQVKSDGSQKFSITVDSSGKVYKTETAPTPLNTRIIDTRHRAFNLGWSIQNSLTMTLTFSDPPNSDIIFPIAMIPPPTRASFDWSGTILVGGQNQTLRIHAISITGTNTILHVDRDCRKNTKKAAIAIDTSQIAVFSADCQTVTIGAFGGTISEP